jgi:environmental stress-induced protein Ves
MRCVRYATVPDTPWSNGGGTTREVFRDTRWRLSIATIAAPGPFSTFSGIDRILVVATGDVELAVAGVRHHLAPGELLRFPGDEPVGAVPNGSAVVVNVMVQQPARLDVTVGRWSGTPALAVVDLGTLDTVIDVDGAVGTVADRRAVVVSDPRS